MPYQWTAEKERLMLLYVVSSSNIKLSGDNWATVANLLGEGVSASAVSQKYYKLRKDAVGLYNGTSYLTPPSTPAKRKSSPDDDGELKFQTPTKRVKKNVKKRETQEAQSCSSYSILSDYSTYQNHYVQNPFSSFGMNQMHPKGEDTDDFLIEIKSNSG